MALRKNRTLLDQATGYVETVRPHVESAIDSASEFVQHTALPALSDAREKAGPALADARDKAGPALADARDKAAPVLAEARDRATPYVAEARAKAAPVIAEARDRATPYVTEVRGKAAPYVADARHRVDPYVGQVRERTAPVIADVRAKTAPVVAAGVAAAGSKAEAVRELASAKMADLQPEPEPAPKKRSKLAVLLVLAGTAGLAAVVAKRLKQNSEDDWQSSYTPSPPPAESPVPGPDAEDDSAGSSPDEALADATGTPHTATTPDDPAEVVDLEGDHRA